MATSAWLRGPSAMRLTEGLASVLKEQRPEYLPALLANYREHGVFQTQNASAVSGLVGFSNAKLGSSKTRFEGLCLLSMLVKDSSSDVFQQHCLSWMRSLQQVIQSQAPVQTVQLAVNILKDILQYSSQLPELAREVGLNCILGILTSLLGLKLECEMAAMEGMTACMICYPRACGSLRDKLGAFFLSKMDSTNKKTQEMACQCYGRLPCLGGLMDRGVAAGRAEGWTNQIHCLLATANSQLTQIYQGAEMDGTVPYEGPGVELAFPHVDQSDPLLLLQLQHRFTAVCLALKHSLRLDPGSAVRLPVRPVLNLVCRSLAVSCKSINLSGDGNVKLLVLPVVHVNTLEVLAALIAVVRSGMVQYAAVLQRLFSQTLSAWTPAPESSLGQQRAYSSVRVSVYQTMELWLQVAGASAGLLQGSPAHSELLFSNLLGDITPGADAVKLRVGLSADVVPGGKPGPRRTKTLVLADPVGQTLQRKGDAAANQDTCLSALSALRQLILTSGTLLKDDVHKRLCDVVLPLCVRLQQQQSGSSSSCEFSGGISGQYGSALTRRELYRLLLALVLVPSFNWPPPLTCAVSIFSYGRIEHNLKVSSFCSEALTICNALVHPRTPSIALPLPPLTLKPTPTAAQSLPTSQGAAPGLSMPAALLGGPTTSGPHFGPRHSLGLLDSLENHLSLVPGLVGPTLNTAATATSAGEMMILSPHTAPHHHPPHQQHHQQQQQQDPAAPGPPEGQKPVFMRYEREEAEDVEISLASDSDDSVVIVPPGMLGVEGRRDEASGALNSQNAISTSATSAGGTAAPPSEGEPVEPTSTIDGVPLANDLANDLAASSTSVNSFPPSSGSVVSLVPPVNSASLPGAPPVDPLAGPGRPQLQQMLMQSQATAPGQGPGPSPIGLPLQMQQLQNQLSRHLQQQQQQQTPAASSNQDSGVININSTDEEEDEDEEDMEEDEEELEDEEDEEGMDEEDEEEVSDYGEEYFDGDLEEYDEEEEEDDEEEEGEELLEEDEDGDIPPLEGAEEKAEDVGMEEGELLQAAVQEAGIASFSVEGGAEGGIEEIQSGRALFGEDRMKAPEVESIGVLEETRGGEEDDDESERMDDPSMPQILCVTGGTMEERDEEDEEEDEEEEEGRIVGRQEEEEEGELIEDSSSWPMAGNAPERENTCGEETVAGEQQSQQEPAGGHCLDDRPSSPGGHQEQQPTAVLDPDAARPAVPGGSAELSTREQPDLDSGGEELSETGQQPKCEGDDDDGVGGSEGEDSKGLKRKREEVHGEEDDAGNSTDKKRQGVEDAMASMLADFVACPPDDDDGGGSNRSQAQSS